VRGWGEGGGRGMRGEMTQTMYAHMNKRLKIFLKVKKKENSSREHFLSCNKIYMVFGSKFNKET
jgi:hypothetical protein